MHSNPAKASLLVIFLTVFIDLLGFGMVLPLLSVYAKHFAEQLGMEPGHGLIGLLVGGLMSSFSLMQFLFAPLWGRLSDRIGRRPVLMVGLAGSVVFYTLFGVATVWRSLPLLFLSRIGAGIAGATISTAQAYIADATTLANRQKGMALIGAAFGLGFAVGPVFAAFAMWRDENNPGPGPGYAAAALSAVALALAYFKLPESWTPGSEMLRHKWFNFGSLRDALATPSVGSLLVALFASVFAFANFESTLALLIQDQEGAFRFTFREVCWTFAFIGLVLSLVQGGVVRRLAGRVHEGLMASIGTVIEILGLLMLARAEAYPSLGFLLCSLAVIVAGFACIMPSLNSLLSRRSDPAKQGGILGVGQSVSALARIIGPMAGTFLFDNAALASLVGVPRGAMPLAFAAVMAFVALALVAAASRRGGDFQHH